MIFTGDVEANDDDSEDDSEDGGDSEDGDSSEDGDDGEIGDDEEVGEDADDGEDGERNSEMDEDEAESDEELDTNEGNNVSMFLKQVRASSEQRGKLTEPQRVQTGKRQKMSVDEGEPKVSETLAFADSDEDLELNKKDLPDGDSGAEESDEEGSESEQSETRAAGSALCSDEEWTDDEPDVESGLKLKGMKIPAPKTAEKDLKEPKAKEIKGSNQAYETDGNHFICSP